jgi:hypothetical protein
MKVIAKVSAREASMPGKLSLLVIPSVLNVTVPAKNAKDRVLLDVPVAQSIFISTVRDVLSDARVATTETSLVEHVTNVILPVTHVLVHIQTTVQLAGVVKP